MRLANPHRQLRLRQEHEIEVNFDISNDLTAKISFLGDSGQWVMNSISYRDQLAHTYQVFQLGALFSGKSPRWDSLRTPVFCMQEPTVLAAVIFNIQ